MAHSNQVREFVITSRGISLQPVYLGPEGVLTGSMRTQQEAKEAAAKLTRRQSIEVRQRELARKRALSRAQIAALEIEIEASEAESQLIAEQDAVREQTLAGDRERIAKRRAGSADAKRAR
jgi:circadian clock protein KaiC